MMTKNVQVSCGKRLVVAGSVYARTPATSRQQGPHSRPKSPCASTANLMLPLRVTN